jgi:predicted ATPase
MEHLDASDGGKKPSLDELQNPPTTYVRSLRIQNVKSIIDATVEFEVSGLTVLVGKNGSGKSSVIEAIGLPGMAYRDGLSDAIGQRWGMTSLLPAGSDQPMTLTYGFTIDDEPGEYAISIAGDGGSPSIRAESLSWSLPPKTSDRTKRERLTRDSMLLREPEEGFQKIADLMAGILSHWGNISVLLTPRTPDSTLPLSPCSSNWASIAERVLGDDTSRNTLLDVVERLSGDILDLRVKTVGNLQVAEVFQERHGGKDDFEGLQGSWLGLNQVSEGTLRVLDLIVALHQPFPIHLLALEEPEAGVHASLAALIVESLREMSARYQIVFTTHSPAILRQVKPQEIRVVEKTAFGTKVSRLLPRQVELVQNGSFELDELLALEGLRAQA